jgi:predicted DCC family thiol-disulfide oxidoreductase YuxK
MNPQLTERIKGKGVVIFDGVCNFCNASVNFMMARDSRNHFLFTANQMDSGRELLTHFGLNPDEVHTVYLVEDGKIYEKSTAALRIARRLNTPWNWAYIFVVIPRFIRDAVYNLIASNRYSWFGKKDQCRLPSPEERARFI